MSMQILLDDQTCDLSARTVGEAIDAGAGLAQARGRLVVEVHVDGTPWNREMLSSPDRFTASADEVRLVTADRRGLVTQALQQAAAELARADALQREAAELIQEGHHPESMDKLGEALSIWKSVGEAVVTGAQAMELVLDEVAIDRMPLADSVRRLNEWLTVIRDALADRDRIGLADTLLYEFPEVVVEWQAILAELERRVNAAGTPGSTNH